MELFSLSLCHSVLCRWSTCRRGRRRRRGRCGGAGGAVRAAAAAAAAVPPTCSSTSCWTRGGAPSAHARAPRRRATCTHWASDRQASDGCSDWAFVAGRSVGVTVSFSDQNKRSPIAPLDTTQPSSKDHHAASAHLPAHTSASTFLRLETSNTSLSTGRGNPEPPVHAHTQLRPYIVT